VNGLKYLFVFALVCFTCISSAYGFDAKDGCGLVISVREPSSPHTEQIQFGLAPSDFDWWRILDPLSKVHIYLQEIEGDFDFRPIGSDPNFTANIWWTGEPGPFELAFVYYYGGTENFNWRFPDNPAQATLTTASSTSSFAIPLGLEPFYINSAGSAQLAINLNPGQVVPEPGSILTIAVGIISLLTRRKHSV